MGSSAEDMINQLKEMRQKASEGGGQNRIDAQHAKGKMTARERISLLIDEGSFQEIEPFMTHRHHDFGLDKDRYPGDGVVAGFGKVDGRRVCVYAQDFTVIGGSFGEVAGKKIAKVMDLAMSAGVPVIGINDGGGARIQEGIWSLEAYGEVFYRNTQASGLIPQISMIMGLCAGGAVYSPAIQDFIIMVRGMGNMYITGPEVIKAVTGEAIDSEILGGADTHNTISGVAHFAATDEKDAVATVKKILSYIPSNNAEPGPMAVSSDDPWRADKALDTLIPADPSASYDMRDVVHSVFDLGSFFEVAAGYALNAIVGFARLQGQPVGVVGQQPAVMAGCIDINASDKIARFVRFCDAFNLPIITFSDSPGFLPGVSQEHGGIIRHGAKILYAYSEASVPKLTVITRKGYGGAMIVMGSKYLRADFVYSWPSAEIAVMGADGAVNILYRKELKEGQDPQEARAHLVQEYKDKFSNPYAAAAAGHIDDVILPSETRQRLIASLELLKDKQTSLPAKKHGSIPL